MVNRLHTPRFQTQDQIDDYIVFVRTIVSHFKGRIPILHDLE